MTIFGGRGWQRNVKKLEDISHEMGNQKWIAQTEWKNEQRALTNGDDGDNEWL